MPAAVGSYQVVVVADSGEVTADSNRSNNLAASASAFTATVPSLAVGGSVSGTLNPGQELLYQINVSPGTSIALTLTAPAGTAALLARAGSLPTDSTFDAYALSTTSGRETVTAGDGQGGTVYVTIEPQASLAAATSFTLQAQAASFVASAISPTSANPEESFTVEIAGSDFTPNTTVALVDGSVRVAPTQVSYQDSSDILAMFGDVSVGSYQAVVTDSGRTSTVPGAFTVSPSNTDPNALDNEINVNLDVPPVVRTGVLQEIVVTYTNMSDQAIPAPLLDITSSDTALAVAGSTNFVEHELMVLAIDQSGPAGILPAGYTGRITITGRPDVAQAHVVNDYMVAMVDSYGYLTGGSGDDDFMPSVSAAVAVAADPAGDPVAAAAAGVSINVTQPVTIDWPTVLTPDRPPGMSSAAWNLVVNNLESDVGMAFPQLQAAMDQDATYLSTLGEHVSSLEDLIGFELDRAEGFGTIASAGTLGSLGYGQFSVADFAASVDATGDVTISQDGVPTFFALQPDGTYLAPNGVFSTLTLSGGTYQLQESDGTVVVFNKDGTFHSQTNPDGTSLTAAYADGELATTTDNLGDVTTFTWNAHGTIATEVAPDGETTTFGYDPTGKFLTSATDALGTTQYRYTTVAGSLEELTSVIDPTGVATDYSYNSSGDITGTSVAGQQPLTFNYPANSPGEVDATEATGATTRYFFDASDSIIGVIDPSGQMVLATTDANGDITAFTNPDGTVDTATYDGSGDVLSLVNPLGDTSAFTYDSTFHQLTSYTDANGYTTSYTVNAQGETTGTTYADDTTDSTTYNSAGQVTSTTGRDGLTTTLTYAPSSYEVTGVAYGDGTQSTYTYDAHHNILTATNAQGKTTFTYNAANEMTSVTYPDGLSLIYTYDAAGRQTSMTDQSGYTEKDVYDAAGRLSKVTDGSGNVLVAYTYDADGRVTDQVNANGTSTTTSYDVNDEVSQIENLGRGGVVLSKFVYTYNVNGDPITMTTLQGVTTYQYDAAGRLISAAMPGGETLTYKYDADGNCIAVTDSGTTTTSTANNVDEVTSSGPATYRYNADGYLTSSTDSTGTTWYTYNASGELVEVTSPTTGTYQYSYDAMGNPIATIHDGVTTDELFDPTGSGSLVGQFNGQTAIDHYVYGLGLVAQVGASGAVNAYGFDAQGNTSVLTGPNGAVLDQYTYLPYGALASSSGSTANPFTFSGQWGVISDGSGLAWMQNREYDASLGRFTQPDPTGLAGGLNPYEYANDAPTAFIDPTGLEPGEGSTLTTVVQGSRHKQSVEDLLNVDVTSKQYEDVIQQNTSSSAAFSQSATGSQ